MPGPASPKDKPNKSAVQMAKAVKVARIAAMKAGVHVPNAATKVKAARVVNNKTGDLAPNAATKVTTAQAANSKIGGRAKTAATKVAKIARHVSLVQKDRPKMASANNPETAEVAAIAGIAVVDPKGKPDPALKGKHKRKAATKTAVTKMAGTISVAVASHVVKVHLQKIKAHPTTLQLDATPPLDRICVQPPRCAGL